MEKYTVYILSKNFKSQTYYCTECFQFTYTNRMEMNVLVQLSLTK